ncbi:hypothetical protein WK55_31430 [Burkholderia ubonensis]|uniref:helix-turn-helix domain-containing protein n=1 Tax=Burkholderia ubonensis TaxID=101571 RepID=UPI00075E51D8|nr:helix-turn-helix domain-containing protein [Burkholderia ubonensis]KVT65665.1 hypothetical protein WK55_31430 [Burkholderia ubonensis]
MALGQRLKQERERKKLSQKELADLVGTSQEAISAAERRDSKRSEFAAKMADVLGVRLEWLLTGEGAREQITSESEAKAHSEGFMTRLYALQKEFATMSDGEKSLVADAMKQFTKTIEENDLKETGPKHN